MKTILKIQSSIFGDQGQSPRLADRYIENVREQHGEVRLIMRDLAADPVPALTLERFQALGSNPDARTADQQAVVNLSDTLIGELKAADMIVFAVPMYNFNIPSGLQSYFDHVARAGHTFHYTADGPEGLIKGKQVAVFLARGGHYGEGHSQTSYLRQILSFIGLDDARFFYAEGLAISDEAREQGLAAARQDIDRATGQLAQAV